MGGDRELWCRLRLLFLLLMLPLALLYCSAYLFIGLSTLLALFNLSSRRAFSLVAIAFHSGILFVNYTLDVAKDPVALLKNDVGSQLHVVFVALFLLVVIAPGNGKPASAAAAPKKQKRKKGGVFQKKKKKKKS